MKHARPDYQGRIVDLQHRIPDGEPVFMLRGSDVHAPEIVTRWAEMQAAAGGDPRLVRMAFDQAREMRLWQRAHGSKVPDLPGDVIEYKADGEVDGQ